MKKALILIGSAALLVFGLVFVIGSRLEVFAQTEDPPAEQPRMRGEGVLHDYMEAALAEKLGLTVEELQSYKDSGKTGWEIAEEQGLTIEEFDALLQEAREAAIDAAVTDGVLTADQAELMKTRGQMMGGDGARKGGPMGGMGGMRMRGGRDGCPMDGTGDPTRRGPASFGRNGGDL